MNPKVQDLIDKIKKQAAGLEFTEDDRFDKRLGELDLLIYELRTVAWVPRKYNTQLDTWLTELEKELANEQWQKQPTTR